jgi:uncharacterized repeat protein (TIGR03803 family)
MHHKGRFPNVFFGANLRPDSAALAIMVLLLFLIFVLLFMTLIAQPAQAQSYKVLHNFTGGGDGASPRAGLTIDAAGTFYGTTAEGGVGYGIVFKLKHSGSGWILNPLHSFSGGNDGAHPWGRVAIARDGTLYGTTLQGGIYGSGTVFHLMPSPTAPRSALVPWNETVLHSFNGSDGWGPRNDLIFDQTGSLYGTVPYGGLPYCDSGCGVVYKLTPSASGWTETLLHSFVGNDGGHPLGGVVFGPSGDLYGVFGQYGPFDRGGVYQLSPSGESWTEQTLHGFNGQDDGAYPSGGLIIDASGNLYGTTLCCNRGNGDGTVFELTPGSGGWSFSTLFAFYGSYQSGPEDKLVMDDSGTLYGTTYEDGSYGLGSVFKLTLSNGRWIYTSLHDFAGPPNDGANPITNVVFDAGGNLYGTTSSGGTYGLGVVWELTP